jgi:hypothetical protein
VTVKADGRYNEAFAVLQRCGAYDMQTGGRGHTTVDVPVGREDVMSEGSTLSGRDMDDRNLGDR